MLYRRIFASFFCIFAAAACHAETLSYRLTVNVNIHGHNYSGSSVIETQWFEQGALSGLTQGRLWVVHVRGEAIAINLEKDGWLFVLLTGPPLKMMGDPKGGLYYPRDPERLLLMAFNAGDVATMTEERLSELSRMQETVEIPPSKLPMIVRFTDLHNPMTVQQVDPKNLPTAFGPIAATISAKLAITNDQPTDGIEDILDWLDNLNGKFLSGKTSATLGLPGSLPATLFNEGHS